MTTQTNFDFIQTPKNDEGKYECERCQTAFNDESEVCWAECGDYSKKHGVPLCAECCEDQQENWGECCDSDHEDGNHEDNDEDDSYDCVVCKKHLYITEMAKCEERELCAECCVGANRRGCPCYVCVANNDDEEQDELNAAIDASGNALY